MLQAIHFTRRLNSLGAKECPIFCTCYTATGSTQPRARTPAQRGTVEPKIHTLSFLDLY